MSGIYKSQVPRLCVPFANSGICLSGMGRSTNGFRPSSTGQSRVTGYLCIDATYGKMRQAGRIVSVLVIVDVGVNGDGRREVGTDIGPFRGRDHLNRVPAQTCQTLPAWRQARRLRQR